MNHSKGMVLSLNKVVDIDSSSVNVILYSHGRAVKSDTLFYIIGKKNNKVRMLFKVLNYYDTLL
jgi:ABC-type transporter Mla MlaB component